MKRYVALMLVALSAAAIAASWSGSFRFSPNSINLTDASRDGRDFRLVQPVKGLSPAGLAVLVSADPGQPLLPQWSFTLAIPQGKASLFSLRWSLISAGEARKAMTSAT